jgi:hypothetical protein
MGALKKGPILFKSLSLETFSGSASPILLLDLGPEASNRLESEPNSLQLPGFYA